MRISRSIVAVCLLGGFALPLQAADLPKQGKFTAKFGWYAAGKVFELEKDHIFWVGEFSGTVFNDAGSGFMHMASVVCPGSNDIHLDGRPGGAEGYCVVTDKDGDKAYSMWSCKGPFPGPSDGDNKWTAARVNMQASPVATAFRVSPPRPRHRATRSG